VNVILNTKISEAEIYETDDENRELTVTITVIASLQ